MVVKTGPAKGDSASVRDGPLRGAPPISSDKAQLADQILRTLIGLQAGEKVPDQIMPPNMDPFDPGWFPITPLKTALERLDATTLQAVAQQISEASQFLDKWSGIKWNLLYNTELLAKQLPKDPTRCKTVLDTLKEIDRANPNLIRAIDSFASGADGSDVTGPLIEEGTREALMARCQAVAEELGRAARAEEFRAMFTDRYAPRGHGPGGH